MNRSELIAFIAGKLATGSNITAAEHVEVENAIVDFIPSNVNSIKCYGRIGPVDIKGTDTTYSTTGNIVSASKITPVGNYMPVRVVMPTGSFPDTSYKIRIDVESGPSSGGDTNNDIRPVMFQKVNATTFDICLEENGNVTQDLYFHIEAVATT